MRTARRPAVVAVFAVLTLAFALVPAPAAAAQSAAPLKVLASNAVRTLVETLQPQAEKAVGHPLAITYGTSANMQKAIEAGESFDVAIMASEMLDALSSSGKIAPNSRTAIARSSVGVGVRASGPKPDVSTPDAMKRALLQAKAVSFTAGGASAPFVDKMAEKLGIAAQLKAKTIGEASTTAAAARVINGSADMILTQVSEILPIRGLQLAGPIPNEFDRYLVFSAGVGSKAPNAAADAALIKFLASPAALPTLKDKGLEPAPDNVTAMLALGAVALAMTQPGAATAAAPLRVRASNAFKTVMDQLRPQCEQAVGRPVELQYETSKNLGKMITAGDDVFDVIILNPEIMEVVTQAGKLAPGSRADVARATFGVGVRSGSPKPDVRTAAAIKKTLQQAKKVTFPNEGASAPFIHAMFDRLGIAAELKPRSMPEPTTAPALANVAEGRADLVITLTSELLAAKGIDFVGPVPDEFQGDLIFSAAVGAKAPNAQLARQLIAFLRTPAVVPTLKANGMEAKK